MLPGSSPYTVLATDNEFMLSMSEGSLPNVRWLVGPVPRALLGTTAVSFGIEADRTEDIQDTAGGTFTLNAAGTALTVAVYRESENNQSGTWTVHGVLAR